MEYVSIKNLDTHTFKYEIVTGSETRLRAGKVIFAIGQRSDLKWLTDDKGVFAGDIASGKCSVIDALASGREAAMQIDCALRERDYADYSVKRTIAQGDLAYKIYPAVRRKLNFTKPAVLPADTRTQSFEAVEGTLSASAAELESYRCLECGYEYVDPAKCIGCGVCYKVCPKGGVISMVKAQKSEMEAENK